MSEEKFREMEAAFERCRAVQETTAECWRLDEERHAETRTAVEAVIADMERSSARPEGGHEDRARLARYAAALRAALATPPAAPSQSEIDRVAAAVEELQDVFRDRPEDADLFDVLRYAAMRVRMRMAERPAAPSPAPDDEAGRLAERLAANPPDAPRPVSVASTATTGGCKCGLVGGGLRDDDALDIDGLLHARDLCTPPPTRLFRPYSPSTKPEDPSTGRADQRLPNGCDCYQAAPTIPTYRHAHQHLQWCSVFVSGLKYDERGCLIGRAPAARAEGER